jgi:tetratricopeptide (TPR) repeat protein
MRIKRYVFLFMFGFVFGLFGCASIIDSTAEKERNPNYVLDRNIIQKADQEFEAGELKRAEELYASIVEQKQKSRFYLYANYGLAKVYLQQSRLDQSKDILSEVIIGSRTNLPDLALKGLVLQADVFEEKKEYSRALLCLLDAEKIVPEDEIFISLFILPLRLALAYEKLKQPEKSNIYFQKAQLNFQKIQIPSDVIEKRHLTSKVLELYEQSIEKFKDDTIQFDIQLYRHQLKFMVFILQMNEASLSSKAALTFERKNLKIRESILGFYLKKDLDAEAQRRDLFERQYKAFLAFQTEIQNLINEFSILTSKSSSLESVLDSAGKLNLQLKLDLEMRRPFNPKATKDFSDVKEGEVNE